MMNDSDDDDDTLEMSQYHNTFETHGTRGLASQLRPRNVIEK